jgi:hypothetical protein
MFNNRTGYIRSSFLIILCFLLVCVVGKPLPASAAVHHYASPSGTPADACTYADPCDLQTAVDQANGDNVYVAEGSYFSTTDEVLYIDHSVSIFGGWDGVTPSPVPDPIAYPSILDGSIAMVNHRVVNVVLEPTETVTLSGFTIRDGNATGQIASCYYADAAGCGGGIRVSGGNITIEDNIIEDNIASTATDITHPTGYGGGIFISDPQSVTIKDNSIHDNDASTSTTGSDPTHSNGLGGGIYIIDATAPRNLVITGNEIHHNNASKAAVGVDGTGDALFLNICIGTIDDNEIHDNNSNLSEQTSTFFATHSDLTISDNHITNNHGVGALNLIDFKGTIDSNVIINPDVWYGVMLESNIYPRFSYVFNNIIARHATADIYLSGSAANPVATRFHHNTVDGAPYGILAYQYAIVEVLNNIISHHATGIHQGGPTNTIVVDSTLFHGNITADIDGVYDAGSLFYGDPYYVDSTHGDYHIQFNSAARDVAQGIGYAYDFEDDPRPMGSIHQYDVGADEFWWKFYLPVLQKP